VPEAQGSELPTSAAEVLRLWPGGARKRFGQHFLVSDSVIARIVEAAGLSAGDPVLEIGPGPGVLTVALLRAGAEVTAVELDRDLADYLRVALPQLHLVQADAARTDLDALLPAPGWRCVSNLPYNVGTRILLRLLMHQPPAERLVLMLQREVAERLLAPPGDRHRGSLTVAVQARARVERVCRVPAGAFRPPPRVESAVIALFPTPVEQVPPDLDEVLRAGFSAPRKTLRNNLVHAWGAGAEALLAAAEVDPGLRPAALDLDAWARLCVARRTAQRTAAP